MEGEKLNSYGAGTLTTDSRGNVTASSEAESPGSSGVNFGPGRGVTVEARGLTITGDGCGVHIDADGNITPHNCNVRSTSEGVNDDHS